MCVCVCACLCLWKTDKKDRVCIVLFTPSVTSACIHRLTHLVYLQLQSLFRKKRITAGMENESMSSRRKVLIFMSHQSKEFTLFLSVYLPVSSSMTLSLPLYLSLSVSLTFPLYFPPFPGSSTLDMTFGCVCQCKYPCFSDHFHFIIFSFLCEAASPEPHLTTERVSSPLSLPFMSFCPRLLSVLLPSFLSLF